MKRGILRGMVKKWDLGLEPRTFGTPETLGTSETPGILGQSKSIATVISLILFEHFHFHFVLHERSQSGIFQPYEINSFSRSHTFAWESHTVIV